MRADTVKGDRSFLFNVLLAVIHQGIIIIFNVSANETLIWLFTV